MDLINVVKRMISAGRSVDAVNARDLWVFVDSKQQFADWIKNRISQWKFLEGTDFTVHKFMNGRSSVIDYYISVEMAKELGMLEDNDQGRQIRRWFISREEKLRTVESAGITLDVNNPTSVLQIAGALAQKLADEQARVVKLEAVVSEQAPKVEALDRLATDTEGSFCIRLAAKHFAIPERKFFLWLQQHDWIFKPGKEWHAYAERLKQGFMEHKVRDYDKPATGDEPATKGMSTQARITAAGMAHLATIFARKGPSDA